MPLARSSRRPSEAAPPTPSPTPGPLGAALLLALALATGAVAFGIVGPARLVPAFADDGSAPAAPGAPAAPAVPEAPAAGEPWKTKGTFEGELVCVGCFLERRYGKDVEPQCTLHSKHEQGFVRKGELYTLLDNGRGHLLRTDRALAGKPIRLEAWSFPEAKVLQVVRYSVKEGERWVAYDYCRHCGFEPGDNGGRDVCADCAE